MLSGSSPHRRRGRSRVWMGGEHFRRERWPGTDARLLDAHQRDAGSRLRRARAACSSWSTLPVHSATRRALRTIGSAITGRKPVPSLTKLGDGRAAGCLMPQPVRFRRPARPSGLRTGRCICRRSAWKEVAGVDALTIWRVATGAGSRQALGPAGRVIRSATVKTVRQRHGGGAGRAPASGPRRAGRYTASSAACATLRNSPNCASTPPADADRPG